MLFKCIFISRIALIPLLYYFFLHIWTFAQNKHKRETSTTRDFYLFPDIYFIMHVKWHLKYRETSVLFTACINIFVLSECLGNSVFETFPKHNAANTFWKYPIKDFLTRQECRGVFHTSKLLNVLMIFTLPLLHINNNTSLQI